MFQINGSTPIASAYPEYAEEGPVLQLGIEPNMARVLGDHRVQAVSAWPTLVLHRRLINFEGLAWWSAILGGCPWVTVEFTAISPVTNHWINASGVLWQPTYEPTVHSASYVSNFQAKIITTCFG